MGKAAAMRARLIEQISRMLQRPGMYATHDQDFEVMCQMRLGDLRFLDGLPELTRNDLGLSSKCRSCGISGPFREVFGKETRCYNEVASVYAEIFHRYGYLAIDRLVSDNEWTALLSEADSAYTEGDTRLSEIVDAFGPPSFRIGRWLLCYAPEEGTGWVFFDESDYMPDVYDPESGRFTSGYPENPLLRSIRLPGADFEQSLRLSPRGEALRHHAYTERLA